MAFAVGALIADLAVLVLPLNSGSSVLLSVLGEGFPFRVQVAFLLQLVAQPVAILVGLMLVRRGRASMAAGVFVGVLVILGLHVIASIVSSLSGWVWQTLVVLSLQTIECVCLFLAARAATR
jgi:hypothetical protein